MGIRQFFQVIQGGLQIIQNAMMELAFGHTHHRLRPAHQAAAA